MFSQVISEYHRRRLHYGQERVAGCPGCRQLKLLDFSAKLAPIARLECRNLERYFVSDVGLVRSSHDPQ